MLVGNLNSGCRRSGESSTLAAYPKSDALRRRPQTWTVDVRPNAFDAHWTAAVADEPQVAKLQEGQITRHSRHLR